MIAHIISIPAKIIKLVIPHIIPITNIATPAINKIIGNSILSLHIYILYCYHRKIVLKNILSNPIIYGNYK